MNETIYQQALQQATLAFEADEVPIGAVIFNSKTGEIISQAHNRTEELTSPLAHAEILAIQESCQKLGVKRLNGYSLFVTVEPCPMCAGAIMWARLDALYYGAKDPKTGAVEQGACLFSHPQTHHKPSIHGGIHADTCGNLMSRFFQSKRKS